MYSIGVDMMRSGAVIPLREGVDADPAPIRAENLLLGLVVQRPPQRREDRQLRVLLVEVLNGVPNGLGRSFHFLGNPSADFGQRRGAAFRHSSGSIEDLFALFVGELAEPGSTGHVVGVLADEPLHGRLQKSHAPSAVDQEPSTDEAALSPAVDRLGGNIEPLADVLDRKDRLLHVFGSKIRARGDVFDEESQVMDHVFAVQHQIRIVVGAILSNPITDVLVRVRFRGIDFAQQRFGAIHLFQFALGRRKPNLLIGKLLQCWMSVASHLTQLLRSKPSTYP
jgi:hypothetical protein